MRLRSSRWLCAYIAAVAFAMSTSASAQTPSPLPGAVGPPAASAPRGSVAAGALDESIRLDGRLDEDAWHRAPSIDNLTMSEPTPGAAPTARTIVRVLADRKALVIGVRCEDPDPAGIVSFTKARDASLLNEDHVKVVARHVPGRPVRLRLRGQPERRALRRAYRPRRRERQRELGRHLGGGDRRDAGRAGRRDPHPRLDAELQAGLREWHFNVQRRIQRLLETDRWAGREPRLPGHADEPRRRADRPAGVRSRASA